MTILSHRAEPVALQVSLFIGDKSLAHHHVMQLGIQLSSLFDAPPLLMPSPLEPQRLSALFQKMDGSESLSFEPGRIVYRWLRPSPEQPPQDILTALKALGQIASGLEGWGISFSDVALVVTHATRLTSPPPLFDVYGAHPLFEQAEDMQLRWSRKITLPSWGQGHQWQHLIVNHILYPDALAPTLVHEQEVNTLVERDTPLSRDAASITSFFEDAIALINQAQGLVAQRFIPSP